MFFWNLSPSPFFPADINNISEISDKTVQIFSCLVSIMWHDSSFFVSVLLNE